MNLQQTFDRARDEIAQAVKAIDEREKIKTKAKAAANKQEPKQEENKSDSGELLPLWCKPQQADPGDGAKAEGSDANSSSAAAQQTLLSAESEEPVGRGNS